MITVTVAVTIDEKAWREEYGMGDDESAGVDAESYIQTTLSECSAGQAKLITGVVGISIEEG